MDNKPFIKLFSTYKNKYFYDVNKNTIIKVNDKVYNLLNKIILDEVSMDSCLEKSGEEVLLIKQLAGEGYLSSKKIKEIVNPFNDLVPYYLSNKIRMLCLQITQQCNFRCDYCVYSGQYKNRTHSNKRMSLDLAKKGIDRLVNHSKDSKEISLGFYGGEPLLEFNLIKECINYAEKQAEGRNITYHITTNGSLINKEIVDFLCDHNVSVTISLDGPKEIHDKNRRFASNNSGTFDIILDNILFVEKNYPEYFSSNFLINTVMDGESDICYIDNFFCNSERLKNLSLSSAFVSDDYTDNNPIKISKESLIYQEYKFFCILWSKLKKENTDNNSVSKIMEQAYSSLSKDSELLTPSKCLPDEFHHGGPCIPGAQRLFMNVDGDFYPCERVSETSELMKIGNVHEGFDMGKIKDILNIGKITEEICKECWAIRMCGLCAAKADKNNEFSKELKLKHCVVEKYSAEELLKNYSVLKELKYDFQDKRKLTAFNI